MKPNYRSTTIANYLSVWVQAISVNVPPVLFVIFRDDYGVSLGQLGTLVAVTFVLQILVDFLLAKYSSKFSPRFWMASTAVLSIIGYGLMALAPVLLPNHIYVGLLAACFFYSCGSGILEVMSSPITDAIARETPDSDKGGSMAFLHSIYCWGSLLAILGTTLLLALLGKDNWMWIPVFWMIVPLTCLLMFLKVPMPKLLSGHEDKNDSLFKKKVFWAALLVMIAAGASEQSVSQWASMFTQKALGISKTAADLMGPCLFAIAMGCGRVFFGIRGDKLNLKKGLMVSGSLCVVGYLTTIFAPFPALSLVGLAICGISVAMMWPGTMVLSSDAMPKGGTQLFAFLALGGDVGCSIGPWITGLVSGGLSSTALNESFHLSVDQFALRGGLLCAIVFPILLLIGIPLLTKGKRNHG